MDYLDAFSHSVIIKLQAVNAWTLVTGALILVYWLVLFIYNSKAWKLRHLPTVSSVISLNGKTEFIKNAHDLVMTGMRKWPGKLFKLPSPRGWLVVIADPTLLADVRKAPDHVLSGHRASEDLMQTQYIFGQRLVENRLHIPLVRTRLTTRLITALIPDLHDEVLEACNKYLPAKEEWSSIPALENMINIIAHASNRIFIGPALCRNPEWIKLCIGFATNVLGTAASLRSFPPFLRPFVFKFIGRNIIKRRDDALKLLGPVMAARRKANMEESINTSNDILSWVMHEAKEDSAVVEVIFLLNFASIHTTSMAASQALFDLVTQPEYMKPLREEVEEVTKRDGWTKTALDQMYKLDSFVKESQRLHPAGVVMMSRLALADFTFSDGTTVPAGTSITASTSRIQLDPNTYEDPLKFDGFRFVKMRERAVLDGHPNKNFETITVGPEFIAFGQGKHACPGRFFASAELKLLLGHIILNYDVKLTDGDVRPPDLVRSYSIVPDPTGRLSFRKRQ